MNNYPTLNNQVYQQSVQLRKMACNILTAGKISYYQYNAKIINTQTQIHI